MSRIVECQDLDTLVELLTLPGGHVTIQDPPCRAKVYSTLELMQLHRLEDRCEALRLFRDGAKEPTKIQKWNTMLDAALDIRDRWIEKHSK